MRCRAASRDSYCKEVFMAIVSIQKNQVLFEAGQPVKELYMILSGRFSVSFPGGEYILQSGDAPGICELYSGSHVATCKAAEDSSVFIYPFSDTISLEMLFKRSPEYCVVVTRSAFRQLNHLLHADELARLACSNMQIEFSKSHTLYQECCARNQIEPGAISAAEPFVGEDPLPIWAVSYYEGFLRLLSEGSTLLSKEPAVPAGLIASTGVDCNKVFASLYSLEEYQKQILSLYLNDTREDALTMYADLYLRLDSGSPDAELVYNFINQTLSMLQDSPLTDKTLLDNRRLELGSVLHTAPGQASSTDTGTAENDASLKDSLQTILAYSRRDTGFCVNFRELVTQYKNTADKTATDDAARVLRQRITTSFYELYTSIFFRAINETEIPIPVRMFLYFGYVDEELAGLENAEYLSRAVRLLDSNRREGVFTLFDWLKAVWEGKREPSRNEFDEDYSTHLRTLKATKQITAAEEAALLQDSQKKVEYELKNMFPTVNKMTFGRISSFCPLYSEHNLIKRPDSSLVMPQTLKEILASIVSIDYGAYYREYVYTNPDAGMPQEFFHIEILPDIILTPNVGTRGVMWQEIEGHKRTTSARMMLSIFYLEDLRQTLVRLTGEYRWEMCKRIQGPRWNDLSERSLTSEYFDYIQFYKKNHDLSAETKDKIKTALQKAHNSFKEMFVQDYVLYILYESGGSPRMTKTARTILFAHCPFAAPVREALKSNPTYKEMLERYHTLQTQQLHKFEMLERRVKNTGAEFPEELSAERRFLEL